MIKFSEAIKKTIEDFEITESELFRKTRESWNVKARKYLYTILNEGGMSAAHIGRLCGKNHTTILNALGKLKKKPKSL